MVDISVSADIRAIVEHLNDLEREVLPQAAARALNKAASQAKTQATREIKQVYNIGTRFLSQRIKLTQRANRHALIAKVQATGGRGLPLMAFSPRQTKQGVSIMVKRGQRKLIRHAFIKTLRSGHTGVFGRGQYVGGTFVFRHKRLQPWPARDLPINELYGPGVPFAFSNRLVRDALARLVREKFPSIFAHELRFALGQTR